MPTVHDTEHELVYINIHARSQGFPEFQGWVGEQPVHYAQYLSKNVMITCLVICLHM